MHILIGNDNLSLVRTKSIQATGITVGMEMLTLLEYGTESGCNARDWGRVGRKMRVCSGFGFALDQLLCPTNSGYYLWKIKWLLFVDLKQFDQGSLVC